MQELGIKCSDGFELRGTLFRAQQSKAAIMIAPATGIKQQFYFSFAKFLCENGYSVLTFDNRGIGQSRGQSINGVDASLVNWGRLDQTAVLEKLKSEFPNSDYHLVGHSAGGQLVGLMKNAVDLKTIFNFACSSGSIRNWKYPFKAAGTFYLNYFIPISNFLFGHTKSQWVGMGEPLPKLVAAQWSKWCNGTGYIKTDLDTSIKEHLYNELRFKSLWLHAIDDEIANQVNVKDMIRVYPNIEAEIVSLKPSDYGFKDIGHMKFFSSKRKILWNKALEWFEHN